MTFLNTIVLKILLIFPNIILISVPVAQWESIVLAAQKVVGSIPREHKYW